MKKKSLWAAELKNGWLNMLEDRLKFHGSLTVEEVSEKTNTGKMTVKKHFRDLVEKGQAKWLPEMRGIQKI